MYAVTSANTDSPSGATSPRVLPGCVKEAMGGRKEMGTSAGNAPKRDGQGRREGEGNENENGKGESNKDGR